MTAYLLRLPRLHAPVLCAAIAVGAADAQGPTGICWEPAYGSALGTADDSVHPVSLPFAFPLAWGGSTSNLDVCSNGFVWLSGPSTSDPDDYTESVAEFLSEPARIAAHWDDLIASPMGSFPGGDVHFNGSLPGRAVVTWDSRELGTTDPVTVQLILFPDGAFTITYRNAGRDGIVGITPGNGAPDPGETDMSQGIQLNLGSTVYEEFSSSSTDPSDLMSTQLWFRPNTAGGYDVAALPATCFASKAKYGEGCPPDLVQGGMLHELFDSNNPNDLTLAGSFSVYFQNTGSGYGVTLCQNACWEPGYQNVVSWGSGSGDDSLSTNHALGFTASFGGVSTSAIDICSNGFLWLVAGSSTSAAYTESASDLATEPTRLAVLWDDLDPGTGGTVYFDTFPGRAVVTWVGVQEYFNAANLNTFQAQLFGNGDIICSYQQVSVADGLLGFSVGNLTTETASVDFTGGGIPSFMPFSQRVERPMVLDLAAGTLPVLGASADYECTGLNGALAVVLHVSGIQGPGTDLAFLGMPGCAYHADAGLASGYMSIQGGTATLSLPIPNVASLTGTTLYHQAIAFAPGINPLNIIASNGLRLILGT